MGMPAWYNGGSGKTTAQADLNQVVFDNSAGFKRHKNLFMNTLQPRTAFYKTFGYSAV
jgi:hypothetical protein